jgi:hypothetical protein
MVCVRFATSMVRVNLYIPTFSLKVDCEPLSSSVSPLLLPVLTVVATTGNQELAYGGDFIGQDQPGVLGLEGPIGHPKRFTRKPAPVAIWGTSCVDIELDPAPSRHHSIITHDANMNNIKVPCYLTIISKPNEPEPADRYVGVPGMDPQNVPMVSESMSTSRVKQEIESDNISVVVVI